MRRAPGQDSPWTLVGLGVLALASAAFGLWAWSQILDGVAR